MSEENGSKLINKLLELQNQMKLYHWQTKLYSRHLASDKFLNKAQNIIDNIIESYQGKYGVINMNENNKDIKLHNIKNDDIIDYLEIFREFLIKDYQKLINKNTNTDLLNLRDELLSNLDITIYLFHQK